MAKMFEDEGNAGCTVSLTLRQLLEEKGQPQIVLSTDTVRTAGKAIARGRKAVSFDTGFIRFSVADFGRGATVFLRQFLARPSLDISAMLVDTACIMFWSVGCWGDCI